MCIFKAHPAFSQFVDIWSLNLGMTVETHVAIEIIADDE